MKEEKILEKNLNIFIIQVKTFILSTTSNVRILLGINTSFVYFGCKESVFPFHIEDVNLGSINRNFWGAPKIWIGISAKNYNQLVKYFK